jgi:hypothetical protein
VRYSPRFGFVQAARPKAVRFDLKAATCGNKNRAVCARSIFMSICSDQLSFRVSGLSGQSVEEQESDVR